MSVTHLAVRRFSKYSSHIWQYQHFPIVRHTFGNTAEPAYNRLKLTELFPLIDQSHLGKRCLSLIDFRTTPNSFSTHRK